jgi:hypothetical protein
MGWGVRKIPIGNLCGAGLAHWLEIATLFSQYRENCIEKTYFAPHRMPAARLLSSAKQL